MCWRLEILEQFMSAQPPSRMGERFFRAGRLLKKTVCTLSDMPLVEAVSPAYNKAMI